ncbi:zeta toxin family protein [Gilliamella apicola]|uniref:zeta toxin family protein n=1 Tax=Gilliamella apicola TaxID=1196095 RepID=UPI002FEDF25A
MVEKDLLVVDKETKDAIVDELWYEISSQNLTSQQSPKAYILGGQPGAGKSTSTDKLEEQYNDNIVTVDLDEYRDQHPNYEALYEKYGKELSSYTHEFAGEIKEEIQKRAIDAKYNIIIDGTLGNVERAEQLIEGLKKEGYQVEVLIHTCPKEVSWQSVNERYENVLNAGEIPRFVPKIVHDKIIEVLPTNADKLSQSKQIESLTVHNRQEKIYDSKIDKGLPSVSIQNEINKNENKLSQDSPVKSQDDIFSKALQTARQKIENKRSISNEKSINKGIEI